ncbi:MAG: NB-ARC domain-containing protein [Leptolyngbyaceae cyanobacterium bins.59]|nr:NB-ARC domain-containing protein [Leptolyngbyaceae cyanobacterium bins.59]
MARPNYGPQVKQRTKRFLETLLDYANGEWEEPNILPIQINWQTEKQFVVRTKLRHLVNLVNQGRQTAKLTNEQVREVLRRLQDFVGILEDNRPVTQGSEDWHFTLKLWYRRQDIAANLRQLEEEWERLRPLRSKQVTGEAADDRPPSPPSQQIRDWGEAPDSATFYGRTEELVLLQDWIARDRCRLVMLLGMGGIGKTALSVKLAEQVQDEFECVIWRSLRNAPPIEELLTHLLNILSNQQLTDLPTSLDGKVTRLLDYLRASRCLLVLDNGEAILGRDERAGGYREGYEGYGHLLRCVGESSHESCLVITSREKPRGLGVQEGQHLPIRSLRLSGLGQEEGQEILQEKGFLISEVEAETLINHYTGNPLALKIVATTIQELFDGNVVAFLEQGTRIFGDISDLLGQQFNRLSDLEKQVMVWLAIHREWVSLAELQADILPSVPQKALLEALESLQLRSLIEKRRVTFTQQPVVMEYVTDHLIEQICQEVMNEEIVRLQRYALIKAQAKDYLREAQIHLILQPIADRLLMLLGDQKNVVQQLNLLLAKLRSLPQKPSYAAGNLINLLWRLQVNLDGYDFSHLTIWQAYLQGMNLQRVNFSHADLTKSVFTQTPGDVLFVAFSPDSKLLATGIDNEICLWQVSDSKQLLTCRGHAGGVQTLAFSPDGNLLASGSHDQTIRVWDVSSGQCLKTLRGHTHRVLSIAFSPEGQRLISGSHDQTIRVWDISPHLRGTLNLKGDCLKVLQEHTNRVLCVKFCTDGQRLLSASQDGTIRVWDSKTGDCLQVIKSSINWMLALDLSQDGQTLATGSDGKSVQLWNLETGHCIRTLPYESQVWSVAFTPDGKSLATASDDQTIRLWDVATGKCYQTLQEHTGSVWLVSFSADGQMMVSASDDRTIKLWDRATGRCLRTLKSYKNWMLSVAFSPDGQGLVSSGEDSLIRVWDVTTGECRQVLSGHTDMVSTVAFVPVREFATAQHQPIVASGSDDQTIKLWDLKTGECLRTIRGHQGWVQSIRFSLDGRWMVSGSGDRTVKLWDWQTGECLQTLEGHIQAVKAVAFHPLASGIENDVQGVLASSSDDQTIKIWDMTTGICVRTLQGHQDWVLTIAFSPCGQRFASGSGDRTLKLWDWQTGDCLQTLVGHCDRVRSLAFSPDGKILASAGEDSVIKLWDSQSGQCLRTLTGHEQVVWSVAFRADGNGLASCSEDGTIRLWDVTLGKCLQMMRSDRPYEGMDITGVTGLTPTQIATLKALGAVERDS